MSRIPFDLYECLELSEFGLSLFNLIIVGTRCYQNSGYQGFTIFQFEAVTVFDRSTVLKSHQAEQSSFASHMVMMLNLLQSVMRQYDR